MAGTFTLSNIYGLCNTPLAWLQNRRVASNPLSDRNFLQRSRARLLSPHLDIPSTEQVRKRTLLVSAEFMLEVETLSCIELPITTIGMKRRQSASTVHIPTPPPRRKLPSSSQPSAAASEDKPSSLRKTKKMAALSEQGRVASEAALMAGCAAVLAASAAAGIKEQPRSLSLTGAAEAASVAVAGAPTGGEQQENGGRKIQSMWCIFFSLILSIDEGRALVR